MSDEKFDIPHKSPLVPELLSNDDTIQFNCYKGISCFNACCKQADITLTPFDILRLKDHLGLTAGEFLKKHTVPFEMDASGLPGIKMKTEDDTPTCLFVNDEGCSVYEARPSSCRYYPAGLMTMRALGASSESHGYCLVKEDHCRGHEEANTVTVGEYRKQQGVEKYDEFNKEWFQIILKKRSSGPTLGKPSQTSFNFFFMASYDVDRFRRFVMSNSFKNSYEINAAEYAAFETDDEALTLFGFKLLKQVLYGENSVPEKAGALEERVESRKEVIEIRRKIELEQHQKSSDVYENMEK